MVSGEELNKLKVALLRNWEALLNYLEFFFDIGEIQVDDNTGYWTVDSVDQTYNWKNINLKDGRCFNGSSVTLSMASLNHDIGGD